MSDCAICWDHATMEVQGEPLCDKCADEGCLYLQKTIVQLQLERNEPKLLEAVTLLKYGICEYKVFTELLEFCFHTADATP
jgi:hypothetical protein